MMKKRWHMNCCLLTTKINGKEICKNTYDEKNNIREIVERDRRTGVEEVMTHKELGISSQEIIRLHNLQYAPEGVSFVVGESLYLWERDNNKLSKILDSCAGSNGYNTYQWYGTDKVFFSPEGGFDFNVWDKEKADIELKQRAVRSFVMNDAQEKIYMINFAIKYYEGIIDMKYKIEEFNMEDGTNKKLLKFNSNNYLLAVVDDRYLYCVQESSKKKRVRYIAMIWKHKKRNVFIRRTKSGGDI